MDIILAICCNLFSFSGSKHSTGFYVRNKK